MLKAIILDYNGLLVDDLDIHEGAYVYASGKLGLDLSRETIRRYISHSPTQKRKLYFGEISDETWQRIIQLKGEYYFDKVAKRNVIFPEVESALQSLSSRYKLAMISNTPRDYFTRVFPVHLVRLFTELIFADEVGHPKPSPDSLFMAMERLRVVRDECCYVGDSLLDIQMAKNAGTRVIGVATGDNSMDELRAVGADAVTKNLLELDRKVEELL
jgi:phosphoglycolate phosphatase